MRFGNAVMCEAASALAIPAAGPDLVGPPAGGGPTTATAIAVVGVGPRGLSVLERILRNAETVPDRTVTVHLVEPHEFGAGAVWRTDQNAALLMNIVASQITAFTDDSVDIAGPHRPGPDLHQWARGVAAGAVPAGDLPAWARAEAERVGTNTYTSRAFYGFYLRWVYRTVLADRPARVRIHEHPCAAVSVTDAGGDGPGGDGPGGDGPGGDGPGDGGGGSGAQVVRLADGGRVVADRVVLALGHGTVEPSAAERTFHEAAAAGRGSYLPPGNPADLDLDHLPAGRNVLMRGLGLVFFDYMILLTEGRGGRFVRDDADELRYVRSGEEPNIVCGSRRGLPLHARADNEKGDRRHEPLLLTSARIAELRHRRAEGRLDFRRDCWPLIAREVECVYYAALVAERGDTRDGRAFAERYAALELRADAERALLAAHGIPESEHWNWERIAHPWTAADVAHTRAWDRFLRSYLSMDVRQARRGNVRSPVKAAVDVLRDIRNELREAINDGGVDGESYRSDLEGWFNSLHAFLSIGPPWLRLEQLGALIDEGVVRVSGPSFTVETDPVSGTFVSRSAVPGDVHEAAHLVDARLAAVDLNRSRNDVLSGLRARRDISPFAVGSNSAGSHATGGVAVTGRPFRVVRGDGTVHPHRYMFGVPTEGANWVTETGIRPHVNSITLGDSDDIARSVLDLPVAHT